METSARPAVIIADAKALWFDQILGHDAPTSLDVVIRDDSGKWLERLKGKIPELAREAFFLPDMVFDAPLSFVRNPICIGRNYLEHAKEAMRSGVATAVNEEYPIFFTKATTTRNRHQGPIIAFDSAVGLDYEAELAVILGSSARHVEREAVQAKIFGYTLINDVTARAVQRQHQQWFMGKSFDGFCPVGPVIVTADEFSWPVDVTVRLSVNGQERQCFNTREMIFDIAQQISWLSRVMTLLPGDLIATGTGDGVGRSFDPPCYLLPGDQVDIDCSEIGRLSNPIVAEPAR